jgi:hypothetical protein
MADATNWEDAHRKTEAKYQELLAYLASGDPSPLGIAAVRKALERIEGALDTDEIETPEAAEFRTYLLDRRHRLAIKLGELQRAVYPAVSGGVAPDSGDDTARDAQHEAGARRAQNDGHHNDAENPGAGHHTPEDGGDPPGNAGSHTPHQGGGGADNQGGGGRRDNPGAPAARPTSDAPIPAEQSIGKGAAFLFSCLLFLIIYFALIGSYTNMLYPALVLLIWMLASSQMKREFGSFYGLFFFVALAIHIYYFQSGFAFNTRTVFFLLAFYIIFVVCTILFAPDKTRTLRISFLITTLTLAIYAMPPFLVKYLSPFWQQALIYGVAAAPLGVLYMLHKISMANAGGYADGFWFWYKVFVVAIPLIVFLLYGNFRIEELLPSFSTSGVDAKGGVSGFYSSLTESIKKLFVKGKGVYTHATDPGAYYTGEVEKNKKAPLGVELSNVRPADPSLNNETPVIIYANVRATSFIGTSVQVTPGCVIDKPGAPAAVVDPPGVEILYGTANSFQCTFPPLKSGTYTVQASASFPFETWAYIPYTFVDEERARNMAKQGQDVNDVLDIPVMPTATYTSGPVTIGMGGSEQPILVRPNHNEEILQPGTRLGLTVENAWDRGKLQYVDKVELKVPRPFVLTDCDRKELQGPRKDDKEPEEYTSYIFQNPTFDASTSYSSITCKITIPKSAAADAARLVETEKATRSFIAVVHYQFAIREQTSVTVR